VHPLQLLLCQTTIWRIPCQAISHDKLQCWTRVATPDVRSKVRNQAKSGHCRSQLKISLQWLRGRCGRNLQLKRDNLKKGLCAIQPTRRSCCEHNFVRRDRGDQRSTVNATATSSTSQPGDLHCLCPILQRRTGWTGRHPSIS